MPSLYRSILIAAIASAGTLALAAERPLRSPVLTEGVIKNTTAMTLVPGTHGGGDRMDIGSLDGCTIHVVPNDDRDRELTWKCGQWFQPPKTGKYLVWLEQNATISDSQRVFHYAEMPFRGRGSLAVHTMRPSGWVALPKDVTVEGMSVRYLSLEDSPIRAFDRRVDPQDSSSPVRVPAGRVVSGVFDGDDKALALSHPVSVGAGKTAYATPKPPAPGTSAVLLVVNGRQERPCDQPILETIAAMRKPDARASGPDRITAIWYGVRGSNARICLRCGDSVQTTELTLQEGHVTTVRRRLEAAE